MNMKGITRFLARLLSLALLACGYAAGPRMIPKPASDHPGNIFLRGEEVTVQLPRQKVWVLSGYDEQPIRQFEDGGKVSAGGLPVGFYRFKERGTSNWVSAGVIEPLTAATPATSPIGIDVAMAWFYEPERMDAVANLCALAGVNWVRDRLSWPEMEPQRGAISASTKYDASAAAQSQAGLRVLQVIHASPPWANPNGKRFPLDLRDAYRFYESMARRWRGQVQAFEPWNEADIPMFGGHTGAEMAALQKAAYLGLKAGNPEMIACLNVFAVHNTNQLSDLDANEAWSYFDTYNLHHYEPFEKYPKLYADHRAVSAGRPLWVSECAVPVKWTGDEKLEEPSDTDLKVQAERVSKTFACSLHEGSAATFYFLLPHYIEGQTQFGILRRDLTPRPAYVALAAVGRLLADARPLGRVESPDESIRAYLFVARPGRIERNVLVAWTMNKAGKLELKEEPSGVFDHLGRSCEARKELALTGAPVFAFLSQGSVTALKLRTAPPAPPHRSSARCEVVMQSIWPENKVDLGTSACGMRQGETETIPVLLYNFGSQLLEGRLELRTTAGLEAQFPNSITLTPMSRTECGLIVKSFPSNDVATIRIRGDFGSAGQSLLSLRVIAK